jgi:ROK family
MPDTQVSTWLWVVAGASTAVAAYALLELQRNKRRESKGEKDAICVSKPPASPSRALIAGIEMGGTTSVVATVSVDCPTTILERFEVATTTPAETMSAITTWLDARVPFAAVGVSSFGPVDLDTTSETYGSIRASPKQNWRMFPLLSAFERYTKCGLCPIAFDTDVNAAAMAEMRHGSHGYCSNLRCGAFGVPMGKLFHFLLNSGANSFLRASLVPLLA